MAEYVLPPWLRVSAVDKGILGNAAEFSSPLNGAVRTYGRPGDRLRFDVRVENASNRTTVAERAYYEGLIAAIRSKANRVWMSPPGYAGPRGSFPASELFTNADFSNGTTGWTGANATLSASNGVLRIKALDSFPGPATVPQAGGTDSGGVAYAPFSIRQLTVQGKGSIGPSGPFLASGGLSVSDYGAFGLRTAALVVPSTSIDGILVGGVNTSGYGAGDYVDIPYASLARCFLVDGGGNYMLQSDAANTTWTATGVTISANAHTAPDGTATADGIIESSGGTFHYIQQAYTRTSVAEDWCGYADVARTTGSRDARIRITDGTGSAECTFDLGSGTAGAASSVSGVTNARAFIVSLGNGYYRCFVVARLQATTAVNVEVQMISGGSNTYSGDGSSRIAVWHMGANRTSVPSRPTSTTTTVVAPETQTGSGLYVKGLPASTSGLLLPGDYVQIGSQLEMVTASLDSDAAGLGYLQLSRPQRTAPADNTPIIVHQPMGKFLFADSDIGWSLRPGLFSDFTIPLVEDVT